jgi:hypothetical protein
MKNVNTMNKLFAAGALIVGALMGTPAKADVTYINVESGGYMECDVIFVCDDYVPLNYHPSPPPPFWGFFRTLNGAEFQFDGDSGGFFVRVDPFSGDPTAGGGNFDVTMVFNVDTMVHVNVTQQVFFNCFLNSDNYFIPAGVPFDIGGTFNFSEFNPPDGPDGGVTVTFTELGTTAACCFDGDCEMFYEYDCIQSGGVFVAESNCKIDACAFQLGACCTNSICVMNTNGGTCVEYGGDWLGLDTDCENCTDDPSSCLGDLSGDGQVDVNDLLILIAAWGVCP